MIRLDDEDKKLAYGPWHQKPTEQRYVDLLHSQLEAGEALIKMQETEIRLLRDELRYLRGYVDAMRG